MTLRIGILGAARVATYALIEPARSVEGVEVVAVAARDPNRARDYAATHGIAHVAEDYAALIAKPDVDAVYNALPPSLHARWSIAAVGAGKPVLCEKPFALTLADVDAMLAAESRSGCLLMEAQHSHYHPLASRMRAVCADGTLGTIRHIDAHFDAAVADTSEELRYLREVGGGALWDLGTYPLHWIRSALDTDWHVARATQRWHASGADTATEAHLVAPGGATARLACAMDGETTATLSVEGTRGRLDIVNPIAPQRGYRFTLTIGDDTCDEHFADVTTYTGQLVAFRDAVAGTASVPTRGASSRDR